jgi:ATP synthase protein I
LALQPRRPVTGWGRGFEAGLEFALCVMLGVAFGYYLDRWLGTEPWLLLVFMGFGFAAGLRVLLRVLSPRETSSDPERGDRER